MRLALAALFGLAVCLPALAAPLVVTPTTVPEWKAVYGRVEARDTVPARSRIGGTLLTLEVTEGDTVVAGQRIATVKDDKIAFQITAIDARLEALRVQLVNAESEATRAKTLLEKGVSTDQKMEQLQTDAEVVRNQIAAYEADRQVIIEQQAEGEVIAPTDGIVLSVPVTRGAVLLSGETVATIGGGGLYLRLAIPERHANLLVEGAEIGVETPAGNRVGTLAKVYPQIETGRVVADVEVADLPSAFVDARLLVRVPIGSRKAILIPEAAVETRFGLDFVRVLVDGHPADRAVILGEHQAGNVEVLTGLSAGDTVVIE